MDRHGGRLWKHQRLQDKPDHHHMMVMMIIWYWPTGSIAMWVLLEQTATGHIALLFSTRCNIYMYISRLCLCAVLLALLLAGASSRAMLASARSRVTFSLINRMRLTNSCDDYDHRLTTSPTNCHVSAAGVCCVAWTTWLQRLSRRCLHQHLYLPANAVVSCANCCIIVQ